MKIFRNINELNILLAQIKEKKIPIGLITTMGCIHKGHLSLIKKPIKNDFFTLTTIYINPTQFDNKKDYLNYPKKEQDDIVKLKNIDCNVLYLPKQKDVYPNGLNSKKTVTKYRNILCDKFRPGHFDGVTTVVESLLKIIKPNHAYFGEKDFQQLKIIQNLNEQLKLNIKIHACPSIRLQNGLSLSSRYNNFSTTEKIIFNKCAYQISLLIKKLKNNAKINLEDFKFILYDEGIKKIDYIEIRNEESLSLSNTINQSRLFIALYIGSIRVIDNFILY